jgi:ribose 5-phosphate isomerase B
MNLYLASDHAGFALKTKIKIHATTHYPNFTLHDLGADGEASVDYPDYGFACARAVVADGETARGIIICGSGIGISIAANRVRGARAALCMNATMATLARQHNDANILALGARLIDEETAYASINAFLITDFEGGRHEARTAKLDTLLTS